MDAVLCNLNTLKNAESILNKNDKYYIHCRGGVRSVIGYGMLKGMGY